MDKSEQALNEYNPYIDEVRQNPYRVFEQLRKQGPCHWSEKFQTWLIIDYSAAKTLLKNKTLSSNIVDKLKLTIFPISLRESIEPVIEMLHEWMLFSDPPQHTKMRKLLNPIFSQKNIRSIENKIEFFCKETLKNLPDSFDFVATIARPLPLLVMCHLLKLPEKDLKCFHEWNLSMAAFIDAGLRTPQICKEALQAINEQKKYFSQKKHQHLPWPLWSMLLGTGGETTANLLTNGLLALFHHPSQYKKLIQNPHLVSSAIEEFLRYDPPIQNVFRHAMEDIHFENIQIKKEDYLQIVIAAINRDPAIFQNPEKFNIEREPNSHLSFGFGIHFCLGWYLAKTITQIFWKIMLKNKIHFKLVPEQTFDWNAGLMLRSLRSMFAEADYK